TARMMEQLVDAVSPSARLILMGDPRQLTSIDAGSAFADIVGPVVDVDRDAGVVVLHKVHRFGGAIFDLAAAVLRGDVDRSVKLLLDGQAQGLDSPVQWIEADDVGPSPQVSDQVLAALVPHWVALVDAAERGDESAAFAELRNCRILCAHRDGRLGASFWNQLAFRSVAAVRAIGRDHGGWYPGRPLLIVENDYQLTVFNGDTGVIMVSSETGAAGSGSSVPDAGPVAVFDRAIGPLRISPERLGPVQTAYASTVHKSQGSQFQQVLVVLPPPSSRVLSRELLYTAITRAQRKVIVLASRESLAAAIERRTVRSSGLQQRLWPSQSPS
ncbi:MAG: ATP-binding domain-containing protein, partial [Actinomycetes bacterium]